MKQWMAGTRGKVVVAVFVLLILAQGVKAMPAQVIEMTYQEQALLATVRIVMYAPIAESHGSYTIARGLGTCVQYRQQNLVVTHDHWGDVLDTATFVQFWSVTDELLAELDADELRNRILYRDGGTMILSAPTSLPGMIELGNPNTVAVGDAVVVLHQELGEQPEQSKLTVQIATVTAIDTFAGNSSVTLRCEDGRTVVHGDSGGGIFHKGKLVGNMWATMTTFNWQVWTWTSFDDIMTETDKSFAAANPLQGQPQQQAEILARQHLLVTLLAE